jgi:hypothetical protein
LSDATSLRGRGAGAFVVEGAENRSGVVASDRRGGITPLCRRPLAGAIGLSYAAEAFSEASSVKQFSCGWIARTTVQKGGILR